MSKFLKLLVQIAFVSVLAPDLANANTFSINVDLDPVKDFYYLPHSDGSVELDTYPTFDPITVNSGDHLEIRFLFGGARVQLSDIYPNNSGIEAVTLSLMPFNQNITGGFGLTINLIDPLGDLVTGPQIFSGDVGFSGGVSFQVARNLTNSNFSFTGAEFDYSFMSLAQPVNLDRALFGVYGGAIDVSAVPEPSSIALLIIGLSIVLLMRSSLEKRLKSKRRS